MKPVDRHADGFPTEAFRHFQAGTVPAGLTADDVLVSAGRVYWNDALEKAVLQSLRERLPGFEYGRNKLDPSRKSNESVAGTAYVRWRNGPDLYEATRTEYWWRDTKGLDFLNNGLAQLLVRALDCWTKIVKKPNGATPRVPFDVPPFLEALSSLERLRLHHVVDGLRHDSDERFFDMFDNEPEHAYDICRYFDRRFE